MKTAQQSLIWPATYVHLSCEHQSIFNRQGNITLTEISSLNFYEKRQSLNPNIFQKVADNPEQYEYRCDCLWGHCGDDPDGAGTKYHAQVSVDNGVRIHDSEGFPRVRRGCANQNGVWVGRGL